MANGLTKVTSNGVVMLENWYDAQSWRIAKEEVVNGQTKKWLYLCDGWEIVAVMNENGQMRETFTRGVGLAGDIGTLVAVTHHTGSAVTPGTYYTHHNHRGDIVLTRSGTMTVGTYDYSVFGVLKNQTGTDVSQFKFSSKERDVSTGFSYYGFRLYSPQWQRWLSGDPIGERGGVSLYQFTRNSPASCIDGYGLLFGWVPLIGCVESAYNLYKNNYPGMKPADYACCKDAVDCESCIDNKKFWSGVGLIAPNAVRCGIDYAFTIICTYVGAVPVAAAGAGVSIIDTTCAVVVWTKGSKKIENAAAVAKERYCK